MGRRAQRKREAKALARHIVKRQIEPQLLAAEMRAAGHKVETGWVSTNPDAEGITVTCAGCGRTAKALAPVPEGQVTVCPDCHWRG